MSAFTKKAITQSFVKLLNQRPLDKITVKDIVEDCGINRNTFYYYYQDIYALLDELLETETEAALENTDDYETLLQALQAATQFVRENRRAVYHIYKSVSRQRLEEYLYTVVDSKIMRLIRAAAKDLEVGEEDLKLIASFYKFALVGMILDWLDGNMQKDAEQIITRLGHMLEGNIYMTLRRAADESPAKA